MSNQGVQRRRNRARADLSWQDLAGCKEISPDLFFDPALARWGLEVCANCPVQKPCGESRHGSEGVWGNHAFYPSARRR